MGFLLSMCEVQYHGNLTKKKKEKINWDEQNQHVLGFHISLTVSLIIQDRVRKIVSNVYFNGS